MPIINKVDLPSAQTQEVTQQLIELIGCNENDIILASAKDGIGIQEIFDAIINRIPAPRQNFDIPTRALIFDSTYNNYRGAIPYVRVVDGVLKPGSIASFFGHNHEYEITEVGHFVMDMIKAKELGSGDVGYVIANIRDVAHILPGDTLTAKPIQAEAPLPGFKRIKPMVFSGLYPSDSDDYNQLRKALDKLKLNDASLVFEPETSEALGFGFRCGFLGLLHMEIIQERLEREFEVNLVTTTPNARYLMVQKNGEEVEVDTPCLLYTSPSPRDATLSRMPSSA